LKREGQALLARQQFRRAAICVAAARSLKPEDPEIARLSRSVQPRPGSITLWPSDRREMVWIPAGEYARGASRNDRDAEADEHPAQTVSIEGFWLDRSEVSNAEYGECVDSGACTPPEPLSRFQEQRLSEHPVVDVDWFQARAYCHWAGKRLPSETERERAARLGATTRFPWGDSWMSGQGNTMGVEGADRWAETSPIRSFQADRWNLYDMVGNVWEWVADPYHRNYRGAPRDGRPWHQLNGDMNPPKRVLRGGSYLSAPFEARVSKRQTRAPDNAGRNTGIRCAADG
jgi:serine/threonine-protein kinase